MAFGWLNDRNVAPSICPHPGLLGMGKLAQHQALDQRSFASMMKTVQLIYNHLCQVDPHQSSYDELDSAQAMRFLSEKTKLNPKEDTYRELLLQISALKVKHIPFSFVERFCLAEISNQILSEYAVNVAEAYVLSYVLLNDPTDMNGMYFKLGTSGLLSPTLINGVRIADVEAIAQFIITSLKEAELLLIRDERWLKPGKNLILMM